MMNWKYFEDFTYLALIVLCIACAYSHFICEWRTRRKRYLRSKEKEDPSKTEREDCADCLYPERSCSRCINRAQNKNYKRRLK